MRKPGSSMPVTDRPCHDVQIALTVSIGKLLTSRVSVALLADAEQALLAAAGETEPSSVGRS